MQERMQYMHEALKDKQPQLFKPPPKTFHSDQTTSSYKEVGIGSNLFFYQYIHPKTEFLEVDTSSL